MSQESEPLATKPASWRKKPGIDETLCFFLGSAALLFASIPYVRVLTIPLSAAGLLVGIAALKADTAKNMLIAWSGLVVSLLTLVLAGLWPPLAYLTSRQSAPPMQAEAPRAVPFPCGRTLKLVPSDPAAWVDASSGAAQQGEVCVGVDSVAIEPLAFIKDGQKNLTKEKYLIIKLQLVCTGTTHKIQFETWGTAARRGSQQQPSLKGEADGTIARPSFSADTQVVGQESKPNLYPKLFANDVLVFARPRGGPQELHLELPAAAFGGNGAIRFRIPSGMVFEAN